MTRRPLVLSAAAVALALVASLAPGARAQPSPATASVAALRALLDSAGTTTLNAHTRYAIEHEQRIDSTAGCVLRLRVSRALTVPFTPQSGRSSTLDLGALTPLVPAVEWEAQRLWIVSARSRTGDAGIETRVLPVNDTARAPTRDASAALFFHHPATARRAASLLAAAIRACGGREPSAAEALAAARRDSARRDATQHRWTVSITSAGARQRVVGSLTYARGGSMVAARVDAVTPHRVELTGSRLAITLGDSASAGRFRVVVRRDGRPVYDESWVAPYGGVSAVMPRP